MIIFSSVQASARLSWAELALILFTLAPARPPTVHLQASSEIVGYQVNLLSNSRTNEKSANSAKPAFQHLSREQFSIFQKYDIRHTFEVLNPTWNILGAYSVATWSLLDINKFEACRSLTNVKSMNKLGLSCAKLSSSLTS